MPKIYQRKYSIPGKSASVTANPNAFGGIGDALGNLAEVANTLAVEKQRIEEEERHYSTQRLGNEVSEVALGFEQQRLSLKGTDAYNSMQAVDEWEKKTREQFVSKQPDKKIARDLELFIAKKSLNLKNSLATYEARQRDSVAEETRLNTLSSSTKSAYIGSGTLQQNMEAYDAAIVNDPRLSDEEKENKLMAGQSAIAAARLDGMIDRQPMAALELIESGMFNEYLDTKQLKHFQGEANKAQKGLETLAKQKEKEAEEALKEAQEETGNNFHEALLDGELDYRTIAKSNLEVTGGNSKEYWRKQLDQIANSKTKSEGDQKTIEAELTSRILADPNGETDQAVTDEVIRKSVADGLKPSTARTIRNFRDKVKDDPLKTDQAKTAIATLNAAKTADMFDSDEVENVRKWGESTRLLKKYIENNPDEDPQVFVDQLLEKEKNGFLRRVFDFLPGVDQAVSPEEKKQSLEIEAGVAEEPDTEFQGWLTRARKIPSNNKYSDKELKKYWMTKNANR